QVLVFQKGQIVCYKGQIPCGLFVLTKGEIHFVKRGKSCHESHFWKAPEGKVLGLESFFKNRPICCHWTMMEPSQLVFIGRSQLESYFT
ncbi:MAG: cyclic nucleotide-binding domain-containing protein, partial [bacterium]|nr:cyclic nucleotide-binding domain-containing protein [bacterium]